VNTVLSDVLGWFVVDLNFKAMKTIENQGMDYVMIVIIMLYFIMSFLEGWFLTA
jgi:hypothetical protein